MSLTKQICSVYSSSKHEGMYLYVKKSDELKNVPEALLERFGQPKLAMTMLLEPEKKLARTDGIKVLESIAEQGYYLQLPPLKDSEMAEVAQKNSKLSL